MVLGAPDRVNIPCLMHDTRLCQFDVKKTRDVSISDEDSLSEIALSGASKLASTYFILFYRSVHVLYTGIQKKQQCLYLVSWACDVTLVLTKKGLLHCFFVLGFQ